MIETRRLRNVAIFFQTILRILCRKKLPQMKLQRFRKVRIWKFGWLVYQTTLYTRFLNRNKIFEKNKVVTCKIPFFVIGLFCTPHSIYPNIGF